MKKKQVIDLILAHYKDDPRLFFHRTIEILKELRAQGEIDLTNLVSSELLPKVKIMPIREERPFNPEVSFEDADALDWTLVPQEDLHHE